MIDDEVGEVDIVNYLDIKKWLGDDINLWVQRRTLWVETNFGNKLRKVRQITHRTTFMLSLSAGFFITCDR